MTNYIGDWLLDIVSISTNRSIEEFDPRKIEAIAHSIVGLRGVIDPLIVRKIGYNADGEEQYELVDGHLQYFSAKRAMEIDPKLEMIRAFVIEKGQDALFQQQVDLLRSAYAEHSQPEPVIAPEANASIDYQQLGKQLELIINSRLTDFANNIRNELANFKVEVISLLNQQTASPQSKAKISSQEFIELVNQLSAQELDDKLKSYRNSHKFLPSLLKQRPFTSIKDMTDRVTHFTKHTWYTIRQNWHG
jgi:hypothetical protein